MPRKLKPGDNVNGYTITQLINVGGMAIAYAAQSPPPARRKVFFKQYKSPTTTVPWYRSYVKYQSELKRRIESSPAKSFSYEFIDFFEGKVGPIKNYFQVFEFVEGGEDMEQILERIRSRPKSVSWEQRLILARVMMAGVSALHEAGVIHCDLKPPNIQLFKADFIRAGYRLKVIDMDYSILTDKKAPWDGHQGYVGSPNYYSPEHLTGRPPQAASDVFTCGLILQELLAGQHPYLCDDDEEYKLAALDHRAERPRLLGKMEVPTTDDEVIDVLHRCLSPNASQRPTAKEVNLALLGRLGSKPIPASNTDVAKPVVSRADTPSRPTSPTPAGGRTLELVGETGRCLRINVQTAVGKRLCRQFGDDAKYFDSVQYTLHRSSGGEWQVIPNSDAVNDTMLNGKAITTPTSLKSGDVLGVGKEAKGIVKLPLTVRLS